MKKFGFLFIRPIYRAFLEKPLWWFLSHVKAYFFAEIGVQLGNMERHLGRDAVVQEQRYQALLERLQHTEHRLLQTEANNSAQWDALEQLLLAMLQQPNILQRNEEPSSALEQDVPLRERAHAASRLH